MKQELLNGAYLILLVTAIIVRKAYELKYGRKKQLRDTPVVEMLLMFLWGLAAGVLPLIYVFSSSLGFANIPLGMPIIRGVAGMTLFMIGIGLLHRSHADLGRLWSPTVNPDGSNQLVTFGVYRKIRHPMYTAHVLWGVGQALLLPNMLAGPLALISVSALLAIRIPREEQAMLDTFGDEYRRYMNTTGCIFPKIILGPAKD